MSVGIPFLYLPSGAVPVVTHTKPDGYGWYSCVTFQATGYIPVDFVVEMCRKYRYTVRVYGKCVRQWDRVGRCVMADWVVSAGERNRRKNEKI